MAQHSGNKRGMALYCDSQSVYSHVCRILIQEKEAECELRFVDDSAETEAKLGELNPYGEIPTLLDRDSVLYDVGLVTEYMDERLPYPPLMPVDPAGRGRTRLMIHRMRRDWLDALQRQGNDLKSVGKSHRQLIRDGLISISPQLQQTEWLLGETYSLADSFMAPLLWRLSVLGIALPKSAESIKDYAGRLFRRPAFHRSLTAAERDMGSS